MSDLNPYEEGLANDLSKARARIKELEAKLAKAVEEIAKFRQAFSAQSRKLQAVLYIDGVKEALAELKGATNDQG